jgi:hypothetical protein
VWRETTDSILLDAALAYAQRGWAVLPVADDGSKRPLLAQWPTRASTDPSTIIAWWERWPTANVGVLTGVRSKIWVVDIDPRNGGHDSWDALLFEHGPIETRTSLTGGGGYHLFFAWDEESPARGKQLAPGIDVKTDGGYVVVPPSTHQSGGSYRWHLDLEPERAPQWLSAMAGARGAPPQQTQPIGPLSPDQRDRLADRALSRAVATVRHALEGARNQTLNREAYSLGRLVGAGVVDRAVVEAALSAAATDAGLERLEVQRTMRSGLDAGVQRPYERPERPAVQAPATDAPPWTAELQRNDKQRVLPTDLNALLIVRHDAQVGPLLAYDVLLEQAVFLRAPPWDPSAGARPVVTADGHRALAYLCPLYGQPAFRAPQIDRALETVAHDRIIDPVRDYLTGLRWDGTPRIERWLSRYLGAADDAYTRGVGMRWLVSAVARALQPGCKADHILVLEGAQGAGKSRALQALASPAWHKDTAIDVESKDGALANRGVWIREFGELGGLGRADIEKWKSFVTRTHDAYRPPYERREVSIPRRCVFAGSTNRGEYLSDATGARRIWPVAVDRVDVDAIVRDRDQLWAEARERYSVGQPWWLEDDDLRGLAEERQSDRQVDDPWLHEVREWVERATQNHAEVTVAAVLRSIEPAAGRWTPAARQRVGDILRALGYTRVRSSTGDRAYLYVRPGD